MRKTIDPVNKSATDPSGEDVFEAVHALMHLYRSGPQRVLREGADALTHMDGKVLGFFARRPGSTQKDLAAYSGRDKGQLGRLIGGLRRRGLIEAHADEVDRRIVRLQLTAEGQSLHQAARRRSRRLAEQAVAALSPEERRQLVELLAKVGAGLEKTG